MSWGTEYDTACAAMERPAPTPAQQAFDSHAYAVKKLVDEMRVLTQTGIHWPNYGDDRIAKMRELWSDLGRELQVLSIEGARPVASRTIPLATFEQVQPKQAAE